MSEQLTELRAWYQTHKTDVACIRAIEAIHSAPASLKTTLKDAYPDPTAIDEERELALVFALTQAAAKIDMLPLLLSALDESMFPNAQIQPSPSNEREILLTRAEEAESEANRLHEQTVRDRARIAELEAAIAAQTVTIDEDEVPAPPETQPELVPTSHIDPAPSPTHE